MSGGGIRQRGQRGLQQLRAARKSQSKSRSRKKQTRGWKNHSVSTNKRKRKTKTSSTSSKTKRRSIGKKKIFDPYEDNFSYV
ncbi:CLUMA_CG002734, isoform A [Clunio marinus]|uniref:CLUMA_CG002734, isoform A n=1 Tax=Clunio marinus TaxID=568069 RepID=A0A1J1HRG6_9DIPT|nr:CLUMA_CG002734, isoform A [Clunio marinus]